MQVFSARALRLAWCAPILILTAPYANAGGEDVLVQCQRPCTSAIAAIRSLGGQVTKQFGNVDAIAGNLPAGARDRLTVMLGEGTVRKDEFVPAPVPRRMLDLSSKLESAQVTRLGSESLNALKEALPDNYLFNNGATGAAVLHNGGNTGQGIIVAIIDSGTANVGALTGSVIGGENFVPGASEPSATATSNGFHGTFVGTMISSLAVLRVANASVLAQSLNLHARSSIIPCPSPVSPSCTAGFSLIPMIGSAPDASLYALKTFPAAGGGAPESWIIAAMDRAITLRRNYNNGMPSVPVSGNGTAGSPFVYNSLKIDVVNMSLGGPTLFAGLDLEDQLTREMLNVGIVIVTSAGNDGFAAMTGGSPGTGVGSLTVGAANDVVHERILGDLQIGLGGGAAFHPSNHLQTADFSSRGPTADGRTDPELLANGVASFGHGATGSLVIASGTSFSGPTVAGAAALLRKASPGATATQIRNALMQSANPNVLGDRSGRYDQGRGFLNIPAAAALLASGGARRSLPDREHEAKGKVVKNLEELGIEPVHFHGGVFSTRVRNLIPGQVKQFYVEADSDTDGLDVTLSNIRPELPAAQQNQLFGDDVFIQVVDAPTSFAEVRALDFTGSGAVPNSDRTYVIDQPQTGLVRVALQGDWTNAGRVSADVTIRRRNGDRSKKTASGKIRQGQTIPVEVVVPAGVSKLVFDLHWKGNWSRYPTNDVDMILLDPNGAANFDGATIGSPERAEIANPKPGIWTVLVDGFTITPDPDESNGDAKDQWRLSVSADGSVLRQQ